METRTEAEGNASRVGASGTVKDHWYADGQLQNIPVPKNGYIFVYVSNESNLDVFFDNLQVIHKPGPRIARQASGMQSMDIGRALLMVPETKRQIMMELPTPIWRLVFLKIIDLVKTIQAYR